MMNPATLGNTTSSMNASEAARLLRQRIEGRSARVGILGLGYVGLPLAVGFARSGFPVTGIDPDPAKVEKPVPASRISTLCRLAIWPRW